MIDTQRVEIDARLIIFAIATGQQVEIISYDMEHAEAVSKRVRELMEST